MRLLVTIRKDIRLQFRYGFYYAGAFVALLWILLLKQIPATSLSFLMPVLLLSNLTITTYFFVAGLVLFEKGEGTLEALVVTPVHIGEYLLSKVLTLSLLALLECAIIVTFTMGINYKVLAFIFGIGFTGAMFVLLGFVMVARYDSINEFIIPAALLITPMGLPLIDYFGLWEHWLYYLHPLQAPLLLLKAAFQDVATGEVLYGFLYSLLWCGLFFFWAKKVFSRFIVRKEGLK